MKKQSFNLLYNANGINQSILLIIINNYLNLGLKVWNLIFFKEKYIKICQDQIFILESSFF